MNANDPNEYNEWFVRAVVSEMDLHIREMQGELEESHFSTYQYPRIELVAFLGRIRLICVWDKAQTYFLVVKVKLPDDPAYRALICNMVHGGDKGIPY